MTSLASLPLSSLCLISFKKGLPLSPSDPTVACASSSRRLPHFPPLPPNSRQMALPVPLFPSFPSDESLPRPLVPGNGIIRFSSTCYFFPFFPSAPATFLHFFRNQRRLVRSFPSRPALSPDPFFSLYVNRSAPLAFLPLKPSVSLEIRAIRFVLLQFFKPSSLSPATFCLEVRLVP